MGAHGKAALFCLVGALVWFAPYLVPGKALLGSHPALFPPGDETVAPGLRDEIAQAAQPLYSDKVLQHDPEVRFSVAALQRGLLPGWNPQVLGGLPHLATGLPATLYPLMAIALIVPPPACYAVIAAVQTALGAFFFFLMLRAFGVRAAAAGVGALLFGGSGWMSAHQQYFQLTAAATWLPLVLCGTQKLLDRRGGAFALGIGVACAFLSGFPQIAFYCVAGPALLVAWRALTATRWREGDGALAETLRGAAACALAGGLGLLGAAPQLLATAELVPWSTRQPLDGAILEAHALPPAGLLSLAFPELLIAPRTAAELAAGEPAESLFGRALVGAGRTDSRFNFFETSATLGLGALVLAAAGLLAGRRGPRGFFVLLLAAGLVLVLPGPLLRASARVPGLDIGDPKRALFLVSLAVAALAALGCEVVLGEARWRKAAWIGAGALALLLTVGAAAAWFAEPDRIRAWAAPRIAASFGVAAADVGAALDARTVAANQLLLVRQLLLGAGALVAFGVALLPWRRGALLGLFAALAAPLGLFWYRADTPVPTAGIGARLALVEHLQSQPIRGRIVRLGERNVLPPLPPKLPMLYRLRDAQGYVAVFLRHWADLFEAVEPGSTETVGIQPLTHPESLALPLFDALDVEYAFAALPKQSVPPEIPGWRLEPIAPPPPADASPRLVLWRNLETLGRARLVTRVRVLRDEAALLERLASPAFAPREEALVDAAQFESILASVPGMDAATPLRAWTKVPAPGGDDGAGELYELRSGDPAALRTPARVELVAVAPDDLQFAVDGDGGLLVQSDCWYPGWRVRIDGTPAPLVRVDHALRGVVVPAGPHRVEFHYLPAPLILGLFLVPVALAGLIATGLRLRREPVPSVPCPARSAS